MYRSRIRKAVSDVPQDVIDLIESEASDKLDELINDAFSELAGYIEDDVLQEIDDFWDEDGQPLYDVNVAELVNHVLRNLEKKMFK